MKAWLKGGLIGSCIGIAIIILLLLTVYVVNDPRYPSQRGNLSNIILLICAPFTVILLLTALVLCMDDIDSIGGILGAKYCSPYSNNFWVSTLLTYFVAAIIFIFICFLIGVLIGFIVGKIKSRQATCRPKASRLEI